MLLKINEKQKEMKLLSKYFALVSNVTSLFRCEGISKRLNISSVVLLLLDLEAQV